MAATAIMSVSSGGCSGSCWCWRCRWSGSRGMFAMLLGYSLPDAGWVGWVSPVLGTVMYVWGGRPFLTGAVERDPPPAARDDAAHRPGHHRGVPRLLGRQPRRARPRARLLVGAGAADRDHAARPLDRDAVAGPDHLGAGLAGRAAARRGRTRRRRRASSIGARPPTCGSATWSWCGPAAGCPPTGAILAGLGQHGRVDDHRRVQAGPPRRRRHRSSPAPWPPTPACGSRSPPSATTPPWPASSAWSPRRRTPPPGRSGSPTGPRRGCSGSRWSPASSPPSSGPLLGLPDEAVVRTITVLVIACPHALGLAIPLVVSIATERAARGGVLVKDRLALETMRTVDTVLFDKTGTLTKGEPTVTAIETAAGHARRRGPRPGRRRRDRLRAPAGPGHRGRRRAPRPPAAPGERLHLVTRRRGDRHRRRPRRCRSAARTCSSSTRPRELPVADRWRADGAIILHVLVDGQVVGALRLADEIRPESRDAVDALHAARRPGRDDHRRRRGRRRLRRRRARHRPVLRRGPARGQGRQGQAAAGRGPAGRHGRRRRQRRPRPGPGRRRHRHRRRHRRRHRLRRRHPRQRRPPLGAVGDRAVPGQLPQDEAEPVVGRRLQPHLGARSPPACSPRSGSSCRCRSARS